MVFYFKKLNQTQNYTIFINLQKIWRIIIFFTEKYLIFLHPLLLFYVLIDMQALDNSEKKL